MSKKLHPLDKTAISAYAKENAKKDHPMSGGFDVSYYDFSTIPGNWDCTNFVSHALLAGGAPPYDTGRNGISPTGWYYKSLNSRSSSWSGVNNLHNFIVGNTTKGPAGYSAVYSPSNDDDAWEVGDIIQFYLSENGFDNWRHSAIITGRYLLDANIFNPKPAMYGALVTGRTADGHYNYDQRAEDIYPYNPKRVIRLTGTYKDH